MKRYNVQRLTEAAPLPTQPYNPSISPEDLSKLAELFVGKPVKNEAGEVIGHVVSACVQDGEVVGDIQFITPQPEMEVPSVGLIP